MDYDVVFVGDERNAVRVTDHRPNRPTSSAGGFTGRPGTRTVVVPPGARPTVITGGGSSAGYYRPQYIAPSPQYIAPSPQYIPPWDPYSFASRFGMTTGELIDAGIQVFAAIK